MALTGMAATLIAAIPVRAIPLVCRSRKHEISPQNYGIMNLQNHELCDSTRAISASNERNIMGNKVQVCVIGAGPGGIAAAKNAVQFGFDVVVFEKNDKVGGNWG